MTIVHGSLAAIRRFRGEIPSRAIWSAVDAGTAPLSSLVMAAGLLRALGAQNYGLIVMALAVSNLSTSINPAIAATTTKFVSEAVGSGTARHFPVARIISGSLLAVVVINVLLVGGAIWFGRALSGLIFGAGAAASDTELRAILILAVLAICIQQLDAIFAASLRGLEKFAYQAIAEVCARTLLTLAVVAVAFETRSVHAALVAYCCAYGVSAIARAIVVRVASREERIFRWPDSADFTRLLSFGGWMWLNALATVAYGTLDRILIGRIVGASAAAHFSVYAQLAQLVHFVPTSLFAFSYPMFSRLRSEQGLNSAAIRQLFRKSARACVAIGAAILATVLVFRDALLDLMGGKTFQHSDTVLILLGLSYFVLTFNVVPYYFLLGIGRSKSVSLLSSGSMVAAIVCMTFLIPAYGENGAALARFAYAFGALALVYQSREALHT
ncbi:MAG: polysaccharide biosynthesis family protein [Gammaproteobacteria bacterium]|nr:polysaccharide biosynthesis family protein [Gammaproteobacteria bacterium]